MDQASEQGHPNEGLSSKEGSKEIEKWTEELIQKGYQRLASPPGLEERSFVLTFRQPQKASHSANEIWRQKAFTGSTWSGVNEVILLDLFEEFVEREKLQYLPIGWSDYRIVRGDTWAVASGNRGSRITSHEEWPVDNPTPDKKAPSVNPFRASDDLAHTNGIEIADEKFFRLSERDLKEYDLFHLQEGKSWQGLGFGRFLAAAGFAVLKKLGVTEVDFHGALSTDFQPIMNALGYNLKIALDPRIEAALPADREKMTRDPSYLGSYKQSIDDFQNPTQVEFIKPFIK